MVITTIGLKNVYVFTMNLLEILPSFDSSILVHPLYLLLMQYAWFKDFILNLHMIYKQVHTATIQTTK